MKNRNGFTYIEILITLSVLAILFVPVMQLFSTSLNATQESEDRITATNLARWQMERIRNLNLTEAQMVTKGDEVYPPEGEPPFLLNKTYWRIHTEMVEASDPLEVRVHVFRESEPQKMMITLVTLVEDMSWSEVIPTS